MTTVNRRQLLASMGAAGLVRPAAAATEMKGKYFESAKLFVDTMVEKGTDRYGKKHTPAVLPFAGSGDVYAAAGPGKNRHAVCAQLRVPLSRFRLLLEKPLAQRRPDL